MTTPHVPQTCPQCGEPGLGYVGGQSFCKRCPWRSPDPHPPGEPRSPIHPPITNSLGI